MSILRKYSDYIILLLVIAVLMLLLIIITDVHVAKINREILHTGLNIHLNLSL